MLETPEILFLHISTDREVKTKIFLLELSLYIFAQW